MQEITRRRFVSMVAPVATGLVLLVSSPETSLVTSYARAEEPKTEEPKKSDPLIELLDDNYKFEVLARELSRPEDLVVNPLDDQIFFVQRTGKGSEKGVYELVNGKPEYRFPGSGHGPRQETRIVINDKNELFVYSRDYDKDNLAVWNTKTGKQLLSIRGPYELEVKGGPSDISARYYPQDSQVSLDSKDARFYLKTRWVHMSRAGSSFNTFLVQVLDRKEKKLIPVKKESSPFKETKEVIEPTVVGISPDNEKSNPRHYWLLRKNLISDKASFITGIHYEGYEKDDPRVKHADFITTKLIKALKGRTCIIYPVFYSFDKEKNQARPIIQLNNPRFCSHESCLDSKGNLYFSIKSWGILSPKYPGQIVRVSKK